MSRLTLLFMLVPLLLSTQVSATVSQFEPDFDGCRIQADDDGKKDKKEGESEEEEPDCD